MYRKHYDSYIQSQEYRFVEQDAIYKQLIELLTKYLPEDAFLEIEELLHAEILFKLETGFQYGFEAGQNEK